jgi:hypothetical protein
MQKLSGRTGKCEDVDVLWGTQIPCHKLSAISRDFVERK